MIDENSFLARSRQAILTDGDARSPRSSRDALHPTIVAKLTAAWPGREPRVVVDHPPICGPRPGVPPTDTRGSDHSAVNESHYPTARRVAR